MTQHPRPQFHQFWIVLQPATIQRAMICTSVALLLSLAIAPAGLADYKPPKSSRPSGRSGGLLTRGFCNEATKGDNAKGAALTALAPLGHTGQTTATRPTFAWYVPDSQPYSIEFTLYSYASSGKPILLYQRQLQSQKGIMQYSLPKNETGLNVGQTYLWQVALLCNPSSPDKDQVLRTDIEVVAMPAGLESSLAKTSDRSLRSNLYAESGFWYDALAEALANPKTKSLTIALLGDLVKVEAAGTSPNAKQQHDRLQQVLNAER